MPNNLTGRELDTARERVAVLEAQVAGLTADKDRLTRMLATHAGHARNCAGWNREEGYVQTCLCNCEAQKAAE